MDISVTTVRSRARLTSVKKQRILTWAMFLLPALAIYIVFMAFPLFNSMRLSFFTGQGLRPDTFVGLQNYVNLLTNPLWRDRFFNALGNTFVFFGIHMLVQNTLGLLFAVLLSSQLKGRNIFRTIIFTPATLSVLVTGFLWSLILNPLWGAVPSLLKSIGLAAWVQPWLGDTSTALPVIALVSSWQWVGLPTMMFLAGLLTISEELLEAARVDGANAWQTFWKIRLPLLTPTIGIVSVLTFVGNFNAFDVVYAMEGVRGEPGYATDIMGTFFYRTAIAGEHPVAQPNMGIGAAVATITFLILLTGVSIWLYYSRRKAVEG